MIMFCCDRSEFQGHAIFPNHRFASRRSFSARTAIGFCLVLMAVFATHGRCFGFQAEENAELKQAQQEYDKAVEAFRSSLKIASEQQIHLTMSSARTASDELKKWKEAIHATNLPRIKMEWAAIRLFEFSPNPDQSLVMLMYQIMNNSFQARRMATVHRVGKLLKAYKAPPDRPPVNSAHENSATLMTGLAAVYVGDMELAEQFAIDFRHALNELDSEEFYLVEQVPYHKANADEEQRLKCQGRGPAASSFANRVWRRDCRAFRR